MSFVTNPTLLESVNGTNNSSSVIPPWQYRWKRPIWSSPINMNIHHPQQQQVSSSSTTTTTTGLDPSSNKKQYNFNNKNYYYIGHATAHILESEFFHMYLNNSNENSSIASNNSNNNSNTTSSSIPCTYLLSVSTVKRRNHRQRRYRDNNNNVTEVDMTTTTTNTKENVDTSLNTPTTPTNTNTTTNSTVVADTMIVQIIRQKQPQEQQQQQPQQQQNTNYDDTSTVVYESILEQTLYWPTTITEDQNDNNYSEQDDDDDDVYDTVDKDSSSSNSSYNTKDGIVIQHKTQRTTSDSGPCAALINHNPLLQLLTTLFVPKQKPNVLFLGSSSSSSSKREQQIDDDDDDNDVIKSSTTTTTITTKNINQQKQQSESKQQQQQHQKIQNGIISIALVRIPKQQQQQQQSTSTTETTTSSTSTNPLVSSSSIDTTTTNNIFVQQQSEANTNTTTTTSFGNHNNMIVDTDLVLVCLCNDGKVHVYSPWKLLFTNIITTTNPNQDWNINNNSIIDKSNEINVETVNGSNNNGMASFFFGSTMLQKIHETILPLSQPISTIELSIPSLDFVNSNGSGSKQQQQQEQQQQQQQQRKSGQKDSTIILDVSNVQQQQSLLQQSPSHVIQEHEKRPIFTPIFDTSILLDSKIDRTTLQHQTIHNIPTLCVAAHNYICIAGSGYKRHYRHQRNQSAINNKAIIDYNNNDTMGGFVTFISLRTMSEQRTIYLPFVPMHLSPFCWDASNNVTVLFLLITGRGGRAIAVRLDDGSSTISNGTVNRPSSGNINNSSVPTKPDESTVVIQQFQIVPIEITQTDDIIGSTPTIIGCDVFTLPPAILLLYEIPSGGGVYVSRRTLRAFASNQSASSMHDYQYSSNNSIAATVATDHTDLQTINIPLIVNNLHRPHIKNKVWCQLGQGWCIVGAGSQSFLICYEGASSEREAFVQELSLPLTNGESVVHNSVLPINPFIAPYDANRRSANNRGDKVLSSALYDTGIRPVIRRDVEIIDDFILAAMESISALNYRDTSVSNSPTSVSRRNRQSFLTTKEKSERLLRYSCQGRKLNHSLQSHALLEAQFPVFSVCSHVGDSCFLSLRRIAVQHSPFAPFQPVLEWLSDRRDYFTAACVALDLLQDFETLSQLRMSFSNDHDAGINCQRLLDGMLPIELEENDATLAQLADIAVSCLIKGGYAMSASLEYFLSVNVNYNPSSASLMLVALLAGALSNDEDHVQAVMGESCDCGINDLDCLLWPVRCLLKVGVSRNRIHTILLLLNATIPDELRRRNSLGVHISTSTSLNLCRSLVTLIVQSSLDAMEILLELVDGRSRLRYWDSLDHSTRMDLSILAIEDNFPLLRDEEIRSWILQILQKCIESEDLASASNIYDKTPSQWLRAIALGSLRNAGYSSECRLHPINDEKKEDLMDRFGFDKYKESVYRVRLAMALNVKLDFDLLIPVLLVLDHRNEVWHEESKLSTRMVLNAVCYHAGRHNKNQQTTNEHLFAINARILMRQCFLLSDVEAGAYLIGGKHGLILHCCNILIDELGWNMDTAEKYVMGDLSILLNDLHLTTKKEEAFTLSDCHRRMLLILEEHVLTIRTYGEFTCGRNDRGGNNIDPVFAATLFFRTWYALTKNSFLSKATLWITEFLLHQLDLPIVNNTLMVSTAAITRSSPHRLVCAALIQALIWPQKQQQSEGKEIDNTSFPFLLGKLLQIEGTFLLQLAQSCCGLVEALPHYMIESIDNNNMDEENNPSNMLIDTIITKALLKASPIRRSNTRTATIDETVSSSIIMNRSTTTTGTNKNMDESFVSAAGSYRDMDVSNISWYT